MVIVVCTLKALVFLIPFVYFSAKDCRFLFYGSRNIDRVYLQAKRIRFVMNPFWLLLGRVRIYYFYSKKPLLHYFNRYPSHKKKELLPKKGIFSIQNAYIKGGNLFIEDETRWPIFRIHLRNIQINKMNVDISTSTYLFFQMKKGFANFNGGQIKIERHGKKGLIQVSGVQWRSVTSLQSLPISSNKLSLVARFRSNGNQSYVVHGNIGALKKMRENVKDLENEEKIRGMKFHFHMKENDFSTTLDLGLQEIIKKILDSIETTWLSASLLWGGRRLFQLMKKPD